jgi:LEA14-like dessication related protein
MMTHAAVRPATVGALALALLVSGCATLKAPTLSIDSLKVGDMGITGAALDVGFRVRNPNPEALVVEKLEYELFLNGKRVGRGYESTGFELAGFAEDKIVSRFDVNLLSLPGAIKEILGDDRGRARVKGDFYVRHEGGLKKLGFDADADVDFRR